MPLSIVRNDITKMKVDAIVNAANSSLLGGGGVDGAIHRAAGPQLLAECRTLGGCSTGDAKITGGYNLPAKYVIHTVGPVWQGGGHGEKEKLRSCYQRSLELAEEHHCESVAFPLISSGIYGYPKDQALQAAVDTIAEFLKQSDMLVYIVVFGKNDYQISGQLMDEVSEYVDDNYVTVYTDSLQEETIRYLKAGPDEVMESGAAIESDLADALDHLDESFSEMLLRKIDERGMSDAQCYKRANVDRRLFSKIRSSRLYKPRKQTALAFAVALELSLDETKDLLMKAGFALSHSSKFDIIVEYFITNQKYDIYEINETLFAFDQCLLGAG